MSDTILPAKPDLHGRLHTGGREFRPFLPVAAAGIPWSLLLLLFLCAPAQAADRPPADTTPQRLVLLLQEKYRQVHSLSFDFTQVTRSAGRERRGAGNAIFLRPSPVNGAPDNDLPLAVMRWNYTQPDEQVILNDGSQLSIYSVGDRQLIITPAEQLNTDITYAFFAGTRNLLDDFNAMAPDPRFAFTLAEQPLQAVRLIPREPHSQLKAVQLWVDRDLLIHHLVIEDHFDSITELTFSNIRLNTIAADDPQQIRNILDLHLLPGTEIITR